MYIDYMYDNAKVRYWIEDPRVDVKTLSTPIDSRSNRG